MMTKDSAKILKYKRLYQQIEELTIPVNSPISRMATISAVLHHKMKGYFWTGFYLLQDGELLVGPYQGPLACLRLKKDTGVCWASVNQRKTIVVDDVEEFPGHIACSSLSKSEIVVPVINKDNVLVGVLDVDSRELANFNEEDRLGLEMIVELIYK
ncbi:GAF domain-containing protein [Labilibacter sediminis]|nr:GAF domain-containing protein [Labilibacter sediminis]